MALHRSKQVCLKPADGHGFLASLQAEHGVEKGGAGFQVDHRASMEVLEAIAHQLRQQLLQRCAEQRLAFERKHAAVLADRKQPDHVARASANDA